MLSYIIISLSSFLIGALSIILFSILKINSKCSNEEENIKIDYGQVAYEEIERIEKNNSEVKSNE